MAHLPLMGWDFADQLKATSKQAVAPGGTQTPEATYYVYTYKGQRVRKVTESQAGPNFQPTPVKLQESIYVGDYDVFRKYTSGVSSDGTNGGVVSMSLERTTFHARTEYGHLADICSRTAGTDPGVPRQVRFQLHNNLGSATIELDDAGALLSYEEYFPFGSSSYKAVASQAEAAKRFRFSGKELDAENGLYYFGARYYAAWLGRWTAADPVVGPESRYDFVNNNPVHLVDPDGRQPVGPPDTPPGEINSCSEANVCAPDPENQSRILPDKSDPDKSDPDKSDPDDAKNYATLQDWMSSRGLKSESSLETDQGRFQAEMQWSKAHPDQKPTMTESELMHQLNKAAIEKFMDPSDPKGEAKPWKLSTNQVRNILIITREAEKTSSLADSDREKAMTIAIATGWAESNFSSTVVSQGNSQHAGLFQQFVTKSGSVVGPEAQAKVFFKDYMGSPLKQAWQTLPLAMAMWHIQGEKDWQQLPRVAAMSPEDQEKWLSGKITEKLTRQGVLNNYQQGIGLALVFTRIAQTYNIVPDPVRRSSTRF
jgi:RHS repeat-associated protein